jgi:hypothetical protein
MGAGERVPGAGESGERFFEVGDLWAHDEAAGVEDAGDRGFNLRADLVTLGGEVAEVHGDALTLTFGRRQECLRRILGANHLAQQSVM